MRLLDLFCGAGGAAMGYHRAGFEVVGVDINPQPRYPFEFHQADALEYVAEQGHKFDAIHASPPCQEYSNLKYRWGHDYDDMIDGVREALLETGKDYVIENVTGARGRLRVPLMLCGTMFDLRVVRHRYFENTCGLFMSPGTCHCRGRVGRRGHLGDREYMTITGHFSNVAKGRRAMKIPWMTQAELTQAIPPAYTEFIGKHLMRVLEAE